MSFFVHLPPDQNTSYDPMYAYPTSSSSSANRRLDAWPIDAEELDDNNGLGFIMRVYVFTISTNPIRHALYTQKYGFGKWLSYQETTGWLVMSDTLGVNETFLVAPTALVLNPQRQIYLPITPGVFFQSTYVNPTQNTLNAVSATNSRCGFTWEDEKGSGPLMPGMAYYIRTRYSKNLSVPVATDVTWTQSVNTSTYLVTSQFGIRAVKVKGVGGATFYSYNIMTLWGKWMSLSNAGVTSFVDGSTTPGPNEEFRFVKTDSLFGQFMIIGVASNRWIRADDNTLGMSSVNATVTETYSDYFMVIPAIAGPPIADPASPDAHERLIAAAAASTIPPIVFAPETSTADDMPAATKPYACLLEVEPAEDVGHSSSTALANIGCPQSRTAAMVAFLSASFVGLMILVAQLMLSAH